MTTKESIKTGLESRGVKGDSLLNSLDLAEDLADKNAEISPDGIVTLYHRTSEKKAREIVRMGRMVGKEPELFFGTHPTGQIEGYGDVAIRVRLPLEKLSLNDLFPHEAHVTMKTGLIGTFIAMEAEMVEPDNVWQMTKEEFMNIDKGSVELLPIPPGKREKAIIHPSPKKEGYIQWSSLELNPITKLWEARSDIQFRDKQELRKHLENIHRLEIKQAIRERKPVPQEILKDYPDLMRESATYTEEVIK